MPATSQRKRSAKQQSSAFKNFLYYLSAIPSLAVTSVNALAIGVVNLAFKIAWTTFEFTLGFLVTGLVALDTSIAALTEGITNFGKDLTWHSPVSVPLMGLFWIAACVTRAAFTVAGTAIAVAAALFGLLSAFLGLELSLPAAMLRYCLPTSLHFLLNDESLIEEKYCDNLSNTVLSPEQMLNMEKHFSDDHDAIKTAVLRRTTHDFVKQQQERHGFGREVRRYLTGTVITPSRCTVDKITTRGPEKATISPSSFFSTRTYQLAERLFVANNNRDEDYQPLSNDPAEVRDDTAMVRAKMARV